MLMLKINIYFILVVDTVDKIEEWSIVCVMVEIRLYCEHIQQNSWWDMKPPSPSEFQLHDKWSEEVYTRRSDCST